MQPENQIPGQPVDQWTPPRKFGKYILESEIDSGGMGIIYKAYRMPEKKAVAIKFMIEQTQYKRFQREATTGLRLRHRNFVRFHDSGEVEGHFYIVMDFINGEPLKKYMRQINLSSDQRLELVHKIVSAIAYAHSQGIIHRDLKPANILVDAKGEPIILDFGLVKHMAISDHEQTALTISGQILGTPGYMSPEQARGDIDQQDERSDIFCLGIILYEVLTARNPFEGNNFLEICYNIANGTPTPIEEVLPGIPPLLSHISNKSLAREKHDRYQSANDFANDIIKYLNMRKRAKDQPTINYDVSAYEAHTPAFAQKQQMAKIICTKCGCLNSHNSINCSRCGNPVRKSSSPMLTPPQGIRVQTPQIQTPQISSPIQPHLASPPPTGKARIETGPILFSPEKNAEFLREQMEEMEETIFNKYPFIIGAIFTPFAMIPMTNFLNMPFYSYILDIIFGALAEMMVRAYGTKSFLTGIVFTLMGFLSLSCKYVLLLSTSPLATKPMIAVLVSILLMFFLGGSFGLISEMRSKNENL